MIETTDHNGIAELRLAHGAVNALDLELLQAIPPALADVADARAVVLTGAGRSFSGGVDLKRIVDGGEPYAREFLPALGTATLAVFDHPRPVVAAVHGHALAGGCVLAAACDLRLMSGGTIGLTEMLVGAPFPTVALEVMRHVVGAGLSRTVFGAERMRPQEALAAGLVDEVVPEEELLATALRRAGRLGEVAPEVYALTKQQLRRPVKERIAAAAGDDETVIGLWSAEHVRAGFAAYLAELAARRP